MSSININSNQASLNTQRRLGQTTQDLRLSFERLSSGLRINRARDDAAGLAISSSLDVDRRVFSQGIRNFNDGIAALNIADSSLNELSNIVVRLAELTEQAMNGSIGSKQRFALDQEAQELKDEYLRIAQTTSYNGLNLFDGSTDSLRLQGGFGINGAIVAGVGGAIGDGAFSSVTTVAVSGNGLQSLQLGDLNGDGFVDLISANYNQDSLNVLLGRGDGTFQAVQSYVAPTNGLGGPKLELSDFNGDGILDALVSENDTKYILLGNGNGSFRAAISAVSLGYNIQAADVNADGKIDIVSASVATDTVYIAIGNGDGTFRASTSYGTFQTLDTRDLKVEDINGDGRVDVVAIGSTSIAVYLGNGDGSFRHRTTFTQTGVDFDSIELTDLNRDGSLDVLAGNDSSLAVLLGNGDGSFKANVSFTTFGGNTAWLSTGDFNGDGLTDVATSDYNGPELNIFIGNGNGSFRSAQTLGTGGGPDITTGDINGDGVTDLVSTNYAGSVNLLLGNSNDGVGPLLPFSLKFAFEARQALPVFKNKLAQIALQRGTIGAINSRLSVGINTLQVGSDNAAEAASRIRDVDVAEESANLVRSNILQQAAAAVLAQANQGPALALKLLGG